MSSQARMHSNPREAVKLMKFVSLFAVGGTERQFVNLALSLEPSRFAVHFGCLRRWGQLLEPIEERGIPVFDYRVFTFRNLHAARAQLQLARDIRHHGIQIVHTYNFYANVFAIPAARLAGVRVIASIRDMGVYLSPTQKRVQRLVCRLADQIVVNANAIKQWLVDDGWSGDRIAVIPNGLDFSRFELMERTAMLHKEFELPPDAKLVGVVGRLVPLKGLEDFLRAAALVAMRFPSARFVIVGDEVFATRGQDIQRDGGYTRSLMEQAVQLGIGDRVVFTGFRSDIERLLPELTVSVQPSLSEGLSNTLLESMAAGVPVVATSVGGAVEVVQDGENALLVPPANPELLAHAICRLLHDPAFAADLGHAGRRSVTERFSMKRMVEATSSLYDSLLQSKGHARKHKQLDALVLDAGLRQSLVTVRSLGRRGRSVAAVETSGDAPTFSSRWCEQQYVSPAPHGTDAYLAYVEELLERSRARVLMPFHDGTIALLRRHRSALEEKVRLALANETALTIAVSKERTLAVAKRLGIHIPESVTVNSVEDVPAALKEIGLPAVVKPNESWICNNGDGGTRVASQLVTTPEETRRAVAELTRLGGSALLQRLLSGRREAVSIFYANGEIYGRFAQWAKRTAPPLGGESVLRQSIEMPADIGAQSERLIREIDLDGYSEVEFRRDSSGIPYLMEINPRLSASVEIAVRSGVDFPYLVYQWASGEPIDKIPDYRVGSWMRHLKGDITTTMTMFREPGRPGNPRPLQAILGFSSSFFRPMAYDYFDWKDPLPAVKASAAFTQSVFKKLWSRDEA
jgi:glycosyltransferase involved in cell wall biosynthesis/predicted ATP-grasp superfamily ATP-dependent carboligase